VALYEQFLPESLKPPEKRKGEALVDYLIGHPDATGDFRFDSLCSYEMARLLSCRPQFIGRCNIDKLTTGCAGKVIIAQPGLLDHFKPTELDWVQILCRRPELVEKLPCYLNKSDWLTILCHQPDLWSRSPFHDFDSSEWSQLIRDQPALAERCPWDRLNFLRSWRDSLLLYPDVVLSYRKDWEPFHHLGGYGPEALAPLIARKPELGEKADFGMFDRKEWMIILESQPQLIDRCDVGKIFRGAPLDLLTGHPELADRFDWKTCSAPTLTQNPPPPTSWLSVFENFIRAQPQLAWRVLKWCRDINWEDLLPVFPEYLLEHDGGKVLFQDNVRALLLAGFLNFDGTGLDSICNNFYDRFGKDVPPPAGWFKEEDFTPAEFLIRSVMDLTNARRFLFRKIRMYQWDFCVKLLNCDREALYRFLPREKCAFLLCSAAPQFVWKKFLDLNPEAVSFRDANGNTLLHAALLRATLKHIDAMLIPGNPERKLYDFLVARGCDPERKNKRGVSCSDLLAMISGKVGLWTEKLVKMTESARKKEV